MTKLISIVYLTNNIQERNKIHSLSFAMTHYFAHYGFWERAVYLFLQTITIMTIITMRTKPTTPPTMPHSAAGLRPSVPTP